MTALFTFVSLTMERVLTGLTGPQKTFPVTILFHKPRRWAGSSVFISVMAIFFLLMTKAIIFLIIDRGNSTQH